MIYDILLPGLTGFCPKQQLWDCAVFILVLVLCSVKLKMAFQYCFKISRNSHCRQLIAILSSPIFCRCVRGEQAYARVLQSRGSLSSTLFCNVIVAILFKFLVEWDKKLVFLTKPVFLLFIITGHLSTSFDKSLT